MAFLTFGSFLFFTGLVAFLTWWLTRGKESSSATGYFLAGRSLTFPLIAGSLLLTNLSTEQLVGLNGQAFDAGFCVMVWEVVSVISMVCMAWFFLPRFLKSGVTTVPEYLKLRFDGTTALITNIIFLVAYVMILLPMVLYTGARGMVDMLAIDQILGVTPEGVSSPLFSWLGVAEAPEPPNGQGASLLYTILGVSTSNFSLVLIVWMVGVIGSIYALFGGLRTVAVSDTLNGVGLLVGGFLITFFALAALGGDGGISAGITRLLEGNEGTQVVSKGESGSAIVTKVEAQERFNSIGSPKSPVPFGAVFSGIFLITLFYWSTNQQIIQRTLGASSLAEGQKGVLLTGALKLLGPIYLVLPGMIAFHYFAGQEMKANEAYGSLVRDVLPTWLTGFFAAAMLGAVLSSFNSALNSSCTLFSLGIVKRFGGENLSERVLVRSSVVFGLVIALSAMYLAPMLDGEDQIFDYLQKMNAIYFIPILSVVFVGMISRRVPAFAANLALLAGFLILICGNFIPQFKEIVEDMGSFYFVGTTFAWLVIMMLVIGEVKPREQEWVQEDAGVVDLTPWKHSTKSGVGLIVAVVTIYVCFAQIPYPDDSEVEPDESAEVSNDPIAGTDAVQVADGEQAEVEREAND
ncbi:MAG: solute:sodium symporter family transporter [Planctomycetota bacterium]|nr:solute:sodium symporter family transporter [Planctomycetota bacterium]